MKMGSIIGAAGLVLAAGAGFAGTSCRDGVAAAIMAERAPVIDGDLSDWNCSAPVLVWRSDLDAESENATLYFMHDEANFYVAYEMTLPGGRMPKNENRPCDRYWRGDIVQLRLCTDKSIGWPLPSCRDARLAKNPRVTCVNLWRDTKAGIDYCHVTPGAKFDCPAVTNPEGSAVKTVSEPGRLVLEARIPWSALGVLDGRCPFAIGEKMPAVADIKWAFEGAINGHAGVAIYRKHPGVFAFLNIDTWGQIEFRPKAETRSEKCKVKSVKCEGESEALKKAYAEIAAKARGAAGPDMSSWLPIAFNLPKRAKVSVNVFDEKGGVVRELIGGEWRDAGRVELRWDGRDALGFPCETGRDYRWGVYAHDGLDVVYEGTVGVSGEPPYETPDGKGGWGADHGPPVACAADDTGRYFVWHKNEQGCGLVKTDFGGKVVWRTTPFVRGGWNEYTAACAANGVLWLIHQPADGKKRPALVKIDAATGSNELFPDGKPFVEIESIGPECPAFNPGLAARDKYVFNCAGLAAIGDTLFVSDLNGNRIISLDAKTGAQKGEIPCDAPRGLAAAPDGSLFAVSGKSVVRVLIKTTEGTENTEKTSSVCSVCSVVENPYALAIGSDGTLYVSDLGESQQIKVFSGDGKLLRTYGKCGGRAFLGKIDYDAFLFPFGLAVDKTGALLVAEASTPKIVTVLDAATGAVRRRYFGYSAYSPSNLPDCDDPRLEYYSIEGPGSFARQRLGEEPEASWDFVGAGLPEMGNPCCNGSVAIVFRAVNGKKYIEPDGFSKSGDTFVATLCLVGDNADIVPVAGVCLDPPANRYAPIRSLKLWMDANGDGRQQTGEFVAMSNVADRVWRWGRTMSMHIDSRGDLFLTTMDNAIIGIPCRGFADSGVPRWDASAAYVAIPEIIAGKKELFHTWRTGPVGLRRDVFGNFYTAVDCGVDYVTPELTKAMRPGMGHTSEFNGIFICKFAPDGSLLWRVGRKAISAPRPGEMLNHWTFAGLVGNDYAVAASEWGTFTVYTADGFFVDSIFDVPGQPGRGQPYSGIGGEDFSGRIAAFPALGEVWAYNSGHSFKVKGFDKNCRVVGEWRTNGVVRLERVAPLYVPGAPPKPIKGASLKREGGKVVFAAHVVDDTPLVNVASGAEAVFKGGDAVGFEIGSVKNVEMWKSENMKLCNYENVNPVNPVKQIPVFTRILAARMGGKDRVIALQTGGTRLSRPQEYTTPAGGTAAFSFVGDAPGATVAFSQTDDGYDVRIEVPESILELDFSKPVFWDAEALFSGNGGKGIGTVRRVYLYNEEKAQTSMVDDTPTEARLHPEGYVEVQL